MLDHPQKWNGLQAFYMYKAGKLSYGTLTLRMTFPLDASTLYFNSIKFLSYGFNLYMLLPSGGKIVRNAKVSIGKFLQPYTCKRPIRPFFFYDCLAFFLISSVLIDQSTQMIYYFNPLIIPLSMMLKLIQSCDLVMNCQWFNDLSIDLSLGMIFPLFDSTS